MKKARLKMIRLFVLLLATMFFLDCNGGENPVQHPPAKEHGTSAAYTANYVCPMHCPESGSEKAGICPGCGMDYVLLSEHMKNGHRH